MVKRTITSTKPVRTKMSINQRQLLAMSQLIGRANLAAKLGMQYGTARDLYEALGYKKTLEYTDFAVRYARQDMAQAIINRPVKVTWRGALEVVETDDNQETKLEKEWKALEKKLGLKSRFVRLDKLTGIGKYGVLLLGLDDVANREDFALEAAKGKKLVYVKPFGEGSAKINKWEKETTNPRYGLPLQYSIEMEETEGGQSSTILVHYSRILHVVDEQMESEVEGTPRLEVVFNRLMDLEKLVGGDAEMFWRGAKPGYAGKLDKDFQMGTTTKEDLLEQINEYEHDLRRILIAEGINLTSLAQQISDPKSHVDVQIQMISAVTGIPKRILTGSERGELASGQDKEEWLTYVQARREEYAEVKIVRPFIDRCIELKVLPEAKKDGYTIKWQDLFAPSEKDKVDIGKVRSEALSKYASSPMAEATIPPEVFLEFFLGLDEAQLELIEAARKKWEAKAIKEEEKLAATLEEEELIRLEEEKRNKKEE